MSKNALTCFHSSPMDSSSVSWYRVLPKPPSLFNHDNPAGTPRRDSLLQHKIVHEPPPPPPHPLDGTKYRRNTFDSLASKSLREPSPEPIRARDPYANESLRLGPLTRKRAASQMADDESPQSTSPASPSTSAAEPTTQFCLCQPDPKIPRPRNGK